MKILIIDDELDLQHAIKGALEDEGYEAIGMHRGDLAIEWAKKESPALVLLDFMMPVMNGAEVFDALREIDGMKSVPIVLMSAIRPGEEVTRRGFRKFLKKPFSLDELLKTVESIVGRPDAPAAASA